MSDLNVFLILVDERQMKNVKAVGGGKTDQAKERK